MKDYPAYTRTFRDSRKEAVAEQIGFTLAIGITVFIGSYVSIFNRNKTKLPGAKVVDLFFFLCILFSGCEGTTEKDGIEPGVYELYLAGRTFAVSESGEIDDNGVLGPSFGAVDVYYQDGSLMIKEQSGSILKSNLYHDGTFQMEINRGTDTSLIMEGQIVAQNKIEGTFLWTTQTSTTKGKGNFTLTRLRNPELIDYSLNKDKIIATVNDKNIYLKDFYQILFSGSVDAIATLRKGLKNLEVIRDAIVCDLIDLELLRQAAALKSGNETDEITAQIAQKQKKSTVDYFHGFLNIPESIYYIDTRDRAMITRYSANRIDPQVIIDDLAVKRMLDRMGQDVEKRKSAHVFHILVGSEANSPEEHRTALKKVNQILEELDQGANFSVLAEKYSEDSGNLDGDLGVIGEHTFVEDLNKAIFDCEVNCRDKIVQTRFGYHIIRVADLKETIVKNEVTKDEIKEALVIERRNLLLEELVGQLYRSAKIEKVTGNCGLVPHIQRN